MQTTHLDMNSGSCQCLESCWTRRLHKITATSWPARSTIF